MYNPINTASGFQVFKQTTEGEGWRQVSGTPSPVLPLLGGLSIPDNATAVLLQATAQTRFCLSPLFALAAPSTFMNLPSNHTLWLPGRPSIYQLCVLLTASGGSFCMQFYSGNGDGGPTLV